MANKRPKKTESERRKTHTTKYGKSSKLPARKYKNR